MKVKINIRNNETESIRQIDYDGIDIEQIEYLWSDGNYGCDCNRYLFFNCYISDEEHSCSEHIYSIQILDADGNIIYDEFDI